MIEPIVPAALAARREEGDYVTDTHRRSAPGQPSRAVAASTLISTLRGRWRSQDRARDGLSATGIVTFFG